MYTWLVKVKLNKKRWGGKELKTDMENSFVIKSEVVNSFYETSDQ